MKVLCIEQKDEKGFADVAEIILGLVDSFDNATNERMKQAAKLIEKALKSKPVKTKTIYQSSVGGEIVSKEFASENKDTTFKTEVFTKNIFKPRKESKK